MPPSKPSEIYQGSDWLTYRWTVAQAFDTLDRIRDLCLQMPVNVAGGSSLAGQPRFDIPEEDIADMFGYVVELCDDLTGELDCVHADLASLLRSLPQAWTAFEMRLHLLEMRQAALKEASSSAPLQAAPDPILTHAGRIRALLKQIDQ